MKEKDVFVIPTLSVHVGLLKILNDADFWENGLLNAVVSQNVVSAYQDTSTFDAGTLRWLVRQKNGQENILLNVKKMADRGVKIMAGTDAGNIGTFHGFSVHTELTLLVEAGLSPWQALAAATTTAGLFLEKPFGVRKGDFANLLVLSASPLEPISNTQKIEMVIQHGRIVDRKNLIKGIL